MAQPDRHEWCPRPSVGGRLAIATGLVFSWGGFLCRRGVVLRDAARRIWRPSGSAVDDHALDVGDCVAIGLVDPHQDVDLTVALAVARSHVSADLVSQHVRDLLFSQAKALQAPPVKTDLDLRASQAGGGLDVTQPFDAGHAVGDQAGCDPLVFDLVGEDLHFYRCLEAE